MSELPRVKYFSSSITMMTLLFAKWIRLNTRQHHSIRANWFVVYFGHLLLFCYLWPFQVNSLKSGSLEVPYLLARILTPLNSVKSVETNVIDDLDLALTLKYQWFYSYDVLLIIFESGVSITISVLYKKRTRIGV